MADKRLRKWVEKKLEQGIEPERVKKSLEETGHDPSIVDEVRSPFDEEPEVDQDVFERGAEEKDRPEEDHSSGEGPVKNVEISEEEESENEDLEAGEENRKDRREIPEISVPSVQLPDIEFNAKTFAVLIFFAISLSGGYFLSSSGVSVPSYEVPASISAGEKKQVSCDRIGVRIRSVAVSNGVTEAQVRVVGDAEVELRGYSSGEMAGTSRKRISGKGEMKVKADVERLVLSPVNCPGIRDSLTIG